MNAIISRKTKRKGQRCYELYVAGASSGGVYSPAEDIAYERELFSSLEEAHNEVRKQRAERIVFLKRARTGDLCELLAA